VFDVSGNAAYAPGGNYHGESYSKPGFEKLLDPNSILEPVTAWRSRKLTSLIPVFTGKDASRALAKSSLKPEDCTPEWQDLDDKEKKVLDDWFTFFSKRYNVVGKVQAAPNL
jgi:membrane-associated progesterone receptor component